MTARDTGRTRARKTAPIHQPEPPGMPPKCAAEVETDRRLISTLRQLRADLRQRNLNNAIELARQASAGYGPLVDHFAELGCRYGHLLDAPPKPSLRVIEGGGE